METDLYTVYGGSLSYFTQKLLAAMKFYAAPHQLQHKSAALRQVVQWLAQIELSECFID